MQRHCLHALIGIEHHKVRLLSRLQGADLLFKPQGPCSVNGSHLHHLFCGDGQGISGSAFLQQGGILHKLQHVVGIVGSCTVHAQGAGDTCL